MKITRRQLRRIIKEAMTDLPPKLRLPYLGRVIRRDRAEYIAVRNDLNPDDHLPKPHMFLKVTEENVSGAALDAIMQRVTYGPAASLTSADVAQNYRLFKVYETTSD